MGFRTQHEAAKAAERLASRGDWTRPREDLLPNETLKAAAWIEAKRMGDDYKLPADAKQRGEP